MLILTRRVGERIAIGDEILITILEVKGKQVRLGIQAPSNTTVHREEIYARILEENKAAAGVQTSDVDSWTCLIQKGQRAEKSSR
mgnify:CR=1 FL=1